ncbi:MBL fold metallo-hydrolase [Christensenellaceae bacterium OttesenSCG-928-L17]|nr:MBL fold metallo-hydrolase [Christensenellaceae bacterium OttesenSCG-928-L17]
MLRIDFINVGDGDATLLRCTENGRTHTVLVDCGRPYVPFIEQSQRGSCIDYLMREEVEQIDLLVVSHLHVDHFGGAMAVLNHIPVINMLALYLPPEDARWIRPPARKSKPVVGLCDELNLWNDTVAFAKSRGVACKEAAEERFSLGGVQWQVHLPDAALCARQRTVFEALYLGAMPDELTVYAVSKERNVSSLILRADYAKRSILLPGDAFASSWENRGLSSCDILKAPHHGDGKSLTKQLLCSLNPEIVVISCQNDPTEDKDRPNAEVLSFLVEQVQTVLCTENRALPEYPAATRNAVRVEVAADGSMTCN